MVAGGGGCLHRSEGLAEPQEETQERMGRDERRRPSFLAVCLNVFLIPFITGYEKEGRKW